MAFNILIIEDEIDFREVLVEFLCLKGYEAIGVDSIAGFHELALSIPYDLMILDRTLPDGDGLAILEMERKRSNIPIIILSGLGDVGERVKGITADADHYLVKPVAMPELLAIIDRYNRLSSDRKLGKPGNWQIILQQWELIDPGGIVVKLTNSELIFLSCLKGGGGVLVHRDQIISALGFSPMSYDVRRIESLVSRLRNKIKEAGIKVFPLVTVYGSGYAFNASINVSNNDG